MAKKTISLRKGGSGKITTAVNLATALYQKGKKTLMSKEKSLRNDFELI